MTSALWTIVLILFAAALCALFTVHLLARMLLRPPRMTDGKALYLLRRMSPADLGLPFEPMSFDLPATDRSPPTTLAAWWIEAAAASDKTVILIHGYGDAKVGAIAWAPTWRSLGYHCLAIDLRAHGESGGTMTTGGVRERDDLDLLINQLLARRPAQTRQVVLFGISLGGGVALATAARRDDLAAVITDSVFADYTAAATEHGELIGAPLPSLLPWTIRWAERLAAIRFDDAKPLSTLPNCECPVMLIHGDADPFVPDDQVLALGKALIDRAHPRDVHWIVEGAQHVIALERDPEAYRDRIAAFLDRALSRQPS